MKIENNNHRLWLYAIAIFVVSVIFRLAYLAMLDIENPIRADAFKYYTLAYNMVVNGAYSVSSSEPLLASTYITPGYPLFLALFVFFSNSVNSFYMSVLVGQAVLSSLSAVFAFYISKRIMGLALSVIAAVCVALSPHLNVFTGYMLTETLFIFLFLAAILVIAIAVEKRSLLLFASAGLLLGFATLVRPALLLFPIIVLIVLFMVYGVKNSKLAAISFLLAFILVLSPWFIWKGQNEPKDEVSLFSSSIALGGYPDLIYKDPGLRGLPYREDPEYNQMAASTKAAVSIIWSRAKEQPLKYLEWYLYGKLVTFWQSEIIVGQGGVFVYPVNSSIYHKIPLAKLIHNLFLSMHFLLVLIALGYSVYFCWCQLFTAKFKMNTSSRCHVPLFLGAMSLIYFSAIHMALAPLPRYAVPLYPLVFMVACAAVYRWGTFFLKSRLG